MSHNIKPGVATGREVQEIFKLAKEKGFALPAVNVIGSNTINGVLRDCKRAKCASHNSIFKRRWTNLMREKAFQTKAKRQRLQDQSPEQNTCTKWR